MQPSPPAAPHGDFLRTDGGVAVNIRPTRTFRSIFAALAVSTALLAGACSSSTTSDAPTTSAVSDGSFPVTVESGPTGSGTDITIAARPTSIVSLSPSATETLWAVGAGDQVKAVDNQSDYPAGIPVTDLSGFSPNVEAILGYAPDLVIASDDMNDLVSGLQKAKVPTLLLPAATSIDDVYAQIERVAIATGHEAEGAEVVSDMRAEIDAAVASVPAREQPLTYFHELDSSLYTVTSTSFIGQIYGLFGMKSIADAAAQGDYPQLSAEFVVQANPDLIFLADSQCCGVTAEAVAARPGWNGMKAVTGNQIHVLDEDLSSRWGPRVTDQVKAVAAIVAQVPTA